MPEVRRAAGAHALKTYLFAAGVGLIGGFVGTLFQIGSTGLQRVIIGEGGLLEAALALPWYEALLIPFGGAIAAALLAYGLTRKRESQGMADVMEAVTMRRAQELSVRSTVSRALSSLALIATGGSVGREGPIVYLSASLGARFSRLARVPVPRLRLFAGCGIAAGMSAAYYTPLGASLFAMEVVLGNFAVDILAPVVVASVVAAVFVGALAAGPLHGWIHGPPLFELPPYSPSHPAEYLLYLGLGCLAAGAGWLFIRSMHTTERLFKKLPVSPLFRLPLGGLLIGVIGLWLPHVWGNGYDAVNLVLRETPLLGFVALLFVMKIVATSITVGSGGSGGIFTPTLFTGAALGLFAGEGASELFPGLVPDAGPYAVVGMAATLSATTQAPIMAALILLEMTYEPQLLVPLMIACVSATVTARALGMESVYLAPLRRRGLNIPEGIEETALTTTRVADIMREDAVWMAHDASFDMIVGMVQKTRRDAIYVLDKERKLIGAIRLHDIKNYLSNEALGAAVIASDLVAAVPAARPAQSLAEILAHFDDPELHELPVVSDGKLLGVVDRRDLIAALSVEVLQQRQLRAKFVDHEGAIHYVEIPRGHAISRIPVPPDMAGRAFGDVNFRRLTGLSVLTIVRRDNGLEKRILPEPATILKASDAFIVMGPETAIREQGGRV